MTVTQDNPLYNPPTAPNFAQIKPEHVDAIGVIIKENLATLDNLLKQENYSWDNLILPLERMENRLAKAFSPIAHLHSVNSTDEWRQAYEKALPLLSAYGTDMSQHSGLFEAIKTLKNSLEFNQLNRTQQKLITDAIEDFERNGVALSDADKQTFKQMSLRLSELTTAFANNVLDATNAWQLHLPDDTRLVGLPESAKALMADLATQQAKEGYLITLDAPVVIPVLSYAQDRSLREQVYRAYNARASDVGENAGEFDNAEIIKEILTLRHKQAQMLGFEDYASLSIAPKMAESSEAVFNFLENLRVKSKSVGEQEMAMLQDYARRNLGLDLLQPWDVGFASEKLRQEKYALSQEDLRPYFPVSKVLDGLFWVTEKLFSVTFNPTAQLSVWHEDVLTFDVLDANKQRIAQFYLDLYARSKKRSGAWMDGAVSRFEDGDSLQLPVAYLVCNFTPPVGEEEAYLTHDEVTTLFHEFGHGLHHMLTQIDIYSMSGINGVEWDAVEQPSQFMENFCYTREGIDALTRHKVTGEKMPTALFDKMIAAKNFQSAMALLRQLEFALFDMRIHHQAKQGKEVLQTLKEVRDEVAVTPDYAHNRFPMQFSHIFAGGYAAGYYSYKWAEVLSADSFSAFEEEGVFNPQTGRRFCDEILAVGSSRTSMDSFIAFRGREPQVDALLKHSGIK